MYASKYCHATKKHVNRLYINFVGIYLLTGAYRESANLTEPPIIKRVKGSSVLFYIDIAATTLPSVSLRLGYTTIIIRVEDPSEIMPAYFVLVSVHNYDIIIYNGMILFMCCILAIVYMYLFCHYIVHAHGTIQKTFALLTKYCKHTYCDIID